MVSSIQRLLKVRNFTFWVNTDTLIGKQFNQDWINPIHLKNNVPDKKDTLILWFLVMTFTLWFYHQLRVKWVCIHIGNSSEHIGSTHSHFKNVCECLTLNGMHTKLASVIIFSMNLHLHLKLKKVLFIVHLIILCTSTETSIYRKFQDKTINLFQAPYQNNWCVNSI